LSIQFPKNYLHPYCLFVEPIKGQRFPSAATINLNVTVDAAMEYFVVQWTDPSGIFSSPNEIASTMEPNPRVVFSRISCDCLKRRINDGRALEQIIYDGLIGDVF
jgi:hypothetical protein